MQQVKQKNTVRIKIINRNKIDAIFIDIASSQFSSKSSFEDRHHSGLMYSAHFGATTGRRLQSSNAVVANCRVLRQVISTVGIMP